MDHIKEIMAHFLAYGDFVACKPFGNGHINTTFLVTLSQGGNQTRYVLQKINTKIFIYPTQLMENIQLVTHEVKKQLSRQGHANLSRKSLTLVKTITGDLYYLDEQQNCWRLFLFIEGSIGLPKVKTTFQAFQAGNAFGTFLSNLSNIDITQIHETIPNFHNIPKRLEKLVGVIGLDAYNRAVHAKPEIEYFLSLSNSIHQMLQNFTTGLIPTRITHNDTKISNVLLDKKNHEALCVVDLDTVMPGYVAYDFGDLVRTSTTTRTEEEKNLEKIQYVPELFDALTQGFLEGTKSFITNNEIDSLSSGAFLITYVMGVRFLTDYLENDQYYCTHYSNQNLVRARTQMKLSRILFEKLDLNHSIVKSFYHKL